MLNCARAAGHRPMVGTEILLRAVAALFGLTFALLLAPAARRSRAALWLAVFLGLVAANQAAEMVRGLQTGAAQVPWYRVASAAAALDPLALYLFAAHLRPGGLRKPARVLAVAIPAFALAVWGALNSRVPFYNDGTFAFPITLSLFTGIVYVALLFWALDGLLQERDRPAWRPLFAAIAIMTMPVSATLVSNVVDGGRTWLHVKPTTLAYFVPAVGLALAIALAVVLRARLSAPAAGGAEGPFLLWTVATVLVLTVALRLQDLTVIATDYFGAPRIGGGLVVGRAGAAIRFTLFGALASTALLRHDALGLSLGTRRRLARVLITVGVVILAASIIPLAEFLLVGGTGALSTLDIALLLSVALLSQGFHRLVDRLAARIYGVPMRGDAAAAQEAYRRAAASAVASGRNPSTDVDLLRMREELGVDTATAAILERLADEGEGGPLREGLHVGGRYHVVRFLGAGGSGRAFLADDARLQRRVVLKEVRDTGDGVDDAALAEARVAGSLAHPHVVAVFDAFRRRGAWVLVLEHAEGGSLDEALRAGRIGPERAAGLFREIVEGAAAVHARNIVHGDLKPQNVLLGADGRPRIADFGLARLARGRTAPLEGPPMGTPDFMAPEQRRGGPITARTDVFALGLMARRLFPEGVPASLAPVVARAMEEEPAARFADAGEMLRALAENRIAS